MARNKVVNIAEAKARLPELVERAAGGEEIIMARNGKPRAMLVPLAKKKNYTYGAGKGKWKGAEHILDNPLPPDILNAFYEGSLRKVRKHSK